MNIDILNYLDKDSIVLGLKPKSKKNIVSTALDHLIQKKKIAKADKKEISRCILRREEMGSTAIGSHIAFPHARVGSVKGIIVCVCICKEGADFDSLDDEPVNVIAFLLSNQKDAGLHLKMLAFLARMLRDKYLVQRLKNAKCPEDVLTLLSKQQQAIR
jgi:mannitol/fructose-specific phosphotransferase system IIA component (Ntr-type)